MIYFTCKCGMQIKVGDKYAGKKGKCPKCKEVVVIPQPDNIAINNPQTESENETVQGNLISVKEKSIHFTCQQCEEVMTAPRDLSGKTMSCSICDSNVVVPVIKPQLTAGPIKPVKPKKDCSYCGEEILESAIKCKHCGEFLCDNSNHQTMVDRVVTVQTQNCSMAVVAFVFAMTSLIFIFTCIPAIICGHIAISQCNNNSLLQGKGYAVAALVVGYLILAPVILIAIFWLGLAGLLIESL